MKLWVPFYQTIVWWAKALLVHNSRPLCVSSFCVQNVAPVALAPLFESVARRWGNDREPEKPHPCGGVAYVVSDVNHVPVTPSPNSPYSQNPTFSSSFLSYSCYCFCHLEYYYIQRQPSESNILEKRVLFISPLSMLKLRKSYLSALHPTQLCVKIPRSFSTSRFLWHKQKEFIMNETCIQFIALLMALTFTYEHYKIHPSFDLKPHEVAREEIAVWRLKLIIKELQSSLESEKEWKRNPFTN